MNDYYPNDDDTKAATTDEEIVAEAHRRFERCAKWEHSWRQNARADAKFANGDSINLWQWDQQVQTMRAGRPCLSVNKVRQHNLQIQNDSRQHKAQVKVSPTGGGATYEASQIFSACIRRIEAQSKAPDAYNTATYHQVETGKGYCRVVTDYMSETSFDQEIFIRRMAKPQSVYLDPDAEDYDKADMRFAFVYSDVVRDRFVAEYGTEFLSSSAPLDHGDDWNMRDHVRVAEYYRRLDRRDHLHQLHDGTVIRQSDMPRGWLKDNRAMISRSRPIARPEVEWFKIAGHEIIERKPVECRYIPIVPWIGEEIVIDGVMDCRGHTRALIDPQRIYNYASSAAAEFIGLQTKTPYIGAVEAIEGHEAAWEAANVENRAILFYNGIDDQGREIPKPAREQPPVGAPAYLELMNTAKEEMMMASGQYEANFGQKSNERSGVAIDKRQREGDNAVYHFIDNQAKGVRQIGRILVDMIPRIYDVQRVIKIMAEDGTQSDVQVDPDAPTAHQHMQQQPDGSMAPIDPDKAKDADQDPGAPDVHVIFNPSVGDYDVTADVGPPFATQREEAANAFTQIMAQNKEAFPIVGDMWAKNSDFPGADELAERLKRGIPAQYQPGPSPEVQKLQQQVQQVTQHGQQIAMQADQHVLALKQENDGLRAQAKDHDKRVEIEDYVAMTNRFKVVGDIDPTAARVMIRKQLSDLMGMPALPIMMEHDAADAEHQQSIMPPDPEAAGAQPQQAAP